MKLGMRKIEECDVQGCLFRMTVKAGFDSEKFISAFMKSNVAESWDSIYHKYQWMGEYYVFDALKDELKDKLVSGKVYDEDKLFWIGYLYRYWHYYTGESSKEIYKKANAKLMNINYLNYHTMSCELAIDKMNEAALKVILS